MASTKISDLTAASALAATDRIPVVQAVGAGPVRTTPEAIKTYIETGGIVTASDPVLDLTQTWNAAGVTFTGWKFNVTNTASASGSLLADWQVGGVSQAKLRKDGWLFLADGARIAGITATTTGIQVNYGGNNPDINIFTNNIERALFYGDGVAFSGSIQIGSATKYGGDVFLSRDAANTLAQRNGTTAQEDRLYRSYTDASNYSRLVRRFNTTTAVIHAEGTGSGSDGSVAFNDAALSTSATVGFVMIPSCAGTPTGVPADIPTGQCPMVVDSSGTKLYVYVGGAWKSCTLA